MTFLEETLKCLNENGRTPQDVLWVGNVERDTYGAWNTFVKLADFEYENGFGGPEIDPNLVVVGKDWWLERYEYDGSEWWKFKTLPRLPHRSLLMMLDIKTPVWLGKEKALSKL